MSVKISRREEKRNTSLRDFILAAIFPLLLTGLIGFLIGKAGGIDAGASSNELAVLSKQVDDTNEKLQEFQGYSTTLDSLRIVLNKEIETFEESYYEAIQQGSSTFDPSVSPLQRWGDKLNAAQQRLADDLSDVYGPALGRDILTEEQLDALTDPLRNLIHERFKALRKLKNDYNSKNLNQQQLSTTITKQEEDSQEKIDESKRALDLVKYDLQYAQKDLDRCKNDLTRALANEPPLPPSFQEEKVAINSAVKDIRIAVPELAKGFLGKKKDIHQEILTAIDAIEKATERIK